MAKLKDGFYKLTASSIGSDLLVLLAGGGAKPISDFALADGTNATGTWNIDISGNAKSSTLSKYLLTGAGTECDANTLAFSDHLLRWYSSIPSTSSNLPTVTGWLNGLLALPLHSNGVTAQLYFSATKALFYRSMASDNWNQIAYTTSDITGNANTASKLQNKVKIWGLDFDGSSDVKGNLTLGYNKIYIGDGTDSFYIGWGAGNLYQYNNYYGHYFSTKSGEVMRINSSGNVGIGTTSPLSKLLVEGATIINGPQNALTINSSGKSSYTLFIKMINPNMSTTYHTSLLAFGYDQTAYNIGYIGFKFVAKDSKSNMVTLGLHSVDHVLNITGNGFVGIGTEVPTASLSVNGHVHIGNSSGVLSSPWKSGIVIGPDGTDKIVATYLTSSTNGATVGAHNSALSAWAPLHLGGTKIHFRVNESLKMELTTSGQLAILKTGASTNSGLVVGGDSSKSNISTSIADLTAMIQIVAGSGGNTNSTAIGFHNPGISSAALEYRNTDVNTGYFKFRSDDSTWGVGINNTGNPRGLLDVNGDIYTNPYIRFVDSQRYCGYFSGGKYLELHNGVGGVGIHLYDDGNAYVYKSGSKYTIIDSGNYSSYALPFYTKTSGDCNAMSQGLTVLTAVASNQNGDNHSAFLTITSIGTPFQLQIPDSSESYIYKRYKSGSSWSGWSKLAAGYADSAGYATSAGNADTVDNKHASDFMPASGEYISGTTVADVKTNLLNYFKNKPATTNAYTSSTFVTNFGNNSCKIESSSVCGWIALNPGYDNYNHGHFLVSEYGNNRLRHVGLGYNTWYGPYTIAYTSDIPTKTSQLTNDSGFITGSYYPLAGNANMSGDNKWIGSTMGGGTDYWRIGGTGTGDNGVCLITIGDNSNDYFQIVIADYSGTNYTALLVKNGGTYAPHFYESSDQRLKTNIQAILNKDNIPQIKEFDWKESGEHSYGLIAQELEEQGYSELVSTKDDGYKTVNYSAALSLIVGKLQVKIKELEKEIEILKNKN